MRRFLQSNQVARVHRPVFVADVAIRRDVGFEDRRGSFGIATIYEEGLEHFAERRFALHGFLRRDEDGVVCVVAPVPHRDRGA